MIDTLRIVLFWECNLSCSYCCNEIPEVRKNITPTKLDDIDFDEYDNICISGGEPFLDESLLVTVLEKAKGKNIYIYSNGMKISMSALSNIDYHWKDVKGINIGLHDPKTYAKLIDKFEHFYHLVRFHVQDIYKQQMVNDYPHIKFHYWKMNNCDVPNEEVIVLK